VVRADVDGLLAALARAPTGEETPRQRADMLLSVLGDTRLRDFTGSNGTRVRDAAARALVDLGYPYALELPPEALPPLAERPASLTGARLILGSLSLLANVLTLGPALLIAVLTDEVPWYVSVVAAMLLMGPLLALVGARLRLGWLRLPGLVLMWLEGLGTLLLCFPLLKGGMFLLLLPLVIKGVLHLWAAWELREPWPEEPPQAP
jgi:hypothetical protein